MGHLRSIFVIQAGDLKQGSDDPMVLGPSGPRSDLKANALIMDQ